MMRNVPGKMDEGEKLTVQNTGEAELRERKNITFIPTNHSIHYMIMIDAQRTQS
jgi:hypothetical protein